MIMEGKKNNIIHENKRTSIGVFIKNVTARFLEYKLNPCRSMNSTMSDDAGPCSPTTPGVEPEEEADISIFTGAAGVSKEAYVAGVARSNGQKR